MKCPYCGKELPKDAEKCPRCLAEIKKETKGTKEKGTGK